MQPMNTQDTSAGLLRTLAQLVVKQGVAMGGLPPGQLSLALALVWAGLPADAVLTEPQMNAELKAQLAGAAACLDTDHVELRRWLVDAGWLRRDGYGRAYQRVPAGELGDAQQALAALFDGIDTGAWAEGLRRDHAAAREKRRAAWVAASAGQGA